LKKVARGGEIKIGGKEGEGAERERLEGGKGDVVGGKQRRL